MGAGRTDPKITAARTVETALRTEGRHFEADAVARVHRSLSVAITTLKRLHRDNMELRQRLGLPSFLDEASHNNRAYGAQKEE